MSTIPFTYSLTYMFIKFDYSIRPALQWVSLSGINIEAFGAGYLAFYECNYVWQGVRV